MPSMWMGKLTLVHWIQLVECLAWRLRADNKNLFSSCSSGECTWWQLFEPLPATFPARLCGRTSFCPTNKENSSFFLCDRQNMSSVWWSWIQNETESRAENVIRGRGINSLSFYSQPSWLRTRCWRDSARKWLDCCCQLLAHISRSCSHWDRRDMCEYHQIRRRIFSSYLPSIALYAEHLDTHSANEVMVAGRNF